MKEHYHFYWVGLGLVWASLTGCTNYNEEELYGAQQQVTCEVGVVSFKNDIVPIMQQACISCHASNFASDGIILDTYAGVKDAADNRKSLVPSIKHGNGFTPMPLFSAKLPACDIAKIQAWVDAGSLNN